MLLPTNPTCQMITRRLGLVTDGAPRSVRSLRFEVGRYDATALIARGGMGAVYLGEERTTGKVVALKVLDPSLARHDDLVCRFLSEREVSRRVHHDGLVRVLEGGVSPDGIPYLALELVDGESLGTLLDRGRIELGAVAAIGAQIADAIAALHVARIVHCDLKPDNIMVQYASGLAGWPRIKVLDFGVARFLDRHHDDEHVAGTPSYMAPEQWRGAPDEQSDVYALGCLLYELVSGRAPFEGTVPELAIAHTDQRAPALSSLRAVPAELEGWIHRMLAKDPGMRPRGMAEVARGLAELAFAMPPGASDRIHALAA